MENKGKIGDQNFKICNASEKNKFFVNKLINNKS